MIDTEVKSVDREKEKPKLVKSLRGHFHNYVYFKIRT